MEGGAAAEMTPKGDVLVCPYLHIKIGNIFEQPLKDIINYGFTIKYFKNFTELCLSGEDKDFVRKYMQINDQSIFNKIP